MNNTIEEVFNAKLVELLCALRPEWSEIENVESEIYDIIADNPGLRLDILVRHSSGVPVVVETEFNPASRVEKEAIGRLGLNLKDDGTIEQAIALKVPKHLKKRLKPNDFEREVKRAEFEFCSFSLNEDKSEKCDRWPNNGWINGNLQDLADFIELRGQSNNISVLNSGLNVVQSKISLAADKLRNSLKNRPDVLEKIAMSLKQEDCLQTTRMAMAIVLNTILFHNLLYEQKETIKSFNEIMYSSDTRSNFGARLIEYWNHLAHNYGPIFSSALKILIPLDNKSVNRILDDLTEAANELDELSATTRHNLYGRMFQRLITDRKFLATLYTLPSSAALIAEIATDRLNVDWSNSVEVKRLKVADLACGTGTLLNSTYQAILRKHKMSGRDSSRIHKHMLKEVLVGADIMPAATHMTASLLAGNYPEMEFEDVSCFTLPYGSTTRRPNPNSISCGSLDLLGTSAVYPVLDSGTHTVGNKRKVDVTQIIPDNSCDLVIMNPPYPSSTKHDSTTLIEQPDGSILEIQIPAFAGLGNTNAVQNLMSKKLRNFRKSGMAGHGNAGQATNFFDLAHKKVKCPGGVIALILPETALKGNSWKKFRQILSENYTDIVIFSIISEDPTGRAFTANIKMAEILLVATRVEKVETPHPVKLVNLSKKPESIIESVFLAKKIICYPTVTEIELGDDFVSDVLISDFSHVSLAAGVLHQSLAETIYNLVNGKLVIAGQDRSIPIGITKLGEIGQVGLLHRDIIGGKGKNGLFRGPFDKKGLTAGKLHQFPMLWNHHSANETMLIVQPDSRGKIRRNYEVQAKEVLKQSQSKLHFTLEFGFAAQSLAACYTEEKVIGGRAWPSVFMHETSWEIPVLLWANTTLGLFLFWAHGSRQQANRSILTKTLLAELPILDVRELDIEQLNFAQEIFNSLKNETFLTAKDAIEDPTRKLLDKLVLVDLLGIDIEFVMEDLEKLRERWCAEPTVKRN